MLAYFFSEDGLASVFLYRSCALVEREAQQLKKHGFGPQKLGLHE